MGREPHSKLDFIHNVSYQCEVVSLLFEAGAALLVEAHCQYQRLPLAQRNLEPLPRLIVDVEGVSAGEEFGVVPLVAFNALSTLNRVADFEKNNFLHVL